MDGTDAPRIDRRALLGVALAFAAAPARAATPIGLPGDAGLPGLLDQLAVVDVGDAGKLVRVLVSPRCAHSDEMLGASHALRDKARFRFVPFTGTGTASRDALARLIEDGTPDGLARFLAGDGSGPAPSPLSWQIARRQDEMADTAVSRLLWASTGRPMAAPTIVCAMPGGGVRVVRGAPTLASLSDLVDAAA